MVAAAANIRLSALSVYYRMPAGQIHPNKRLLAVMNMLDADYSDNRRVAFSFKTSRQFLASPSL